MNLRESRKARRRRSLLYCIGSALAIHCGSGAKVQSAPDFNRKSLKSSMVLVLPIAVTDDLGDERTGIVLDHHSREEATKVACENAAELRDDIKVVCFDHPALANASALLRQIMLGYARDAPVPPESFHELARRTGAGFMLLFRPESVDASQRVTKPSQGPTYGVGAVFINPVPIPVILVNPGGEGMGPKVGSVKTSRKSRSQNPLDPGDRA